MIVSPPRGRLVYSVAHAAAMALYIVVGLLTLVQGGVLANRSLPLGLAFATVAALVFVGVGRSSKSLLAVASGGLVVMPYAAQRAGAAVDPTGHLTTLIGVGLLYLVWFLTWRFRPWPKPTDMKATDQ